MKDMFFETINRYMLPIEELEAVIDSTYFLRKNLSFVFAQGYCHPPDGFYGKLINYPDESGFLNIFGRPYATTNKRIVGGRLELIPIDEQLEIHYRVEPDLEKGNNTPPFAEYHTEFRLDDCLGFFEHGHSLRVARELYPWIDGHIEKVRNFLELPVEQLGATGSLAYGKMEPEHEDIDLAVRGSIEEHARLLGKIGEWLKRPENNVFEFGKLWPMRFFYEGILVCPFFIYSRADEIPLADFEMALVRDEVSFRGRVNNDTHSIYLPVVLQLEKVYINGEKAGNMPLIIYDSSMRGEFRNGDMIEGCGKVVTVKKPEEEFEALLVTLGTAIKKT